MWQLNDVTIFFLFVNNIIRKKCIKLTLACSKAEAHTSALYISCASNVRYIASTKLETVSVYYHTKISSWFIYLETIHKSQQTEALVPENKLLLIII